MFPEIGGVDLGHAYRLFLVGVQYLLPLGVIGYAYVRVIHRIWLNEAPGTAMDARDQLRNRNKRKVNCNHFSAFTFTCTFIISQIQDQQVYRHSAGRAETYAGRVAKLLVNHRHIDDVNARKKYVTDIITKSSHKVIEQ